MGNSTSVTPVSTGGESTRPVPVFIPATDIFDAKDKLILVAEIPGADPNSVAVSLDRNVLSIRAAGKMQPPSGYSLIHAEYRDGDYQRAFALGTEVDADGIEATVRDGVLRIVLPKVEPAVRQIAVKAA